MLSEGKAGVGATPKLRVVRYDIDVIEVHRQHLHSSAPFTELLARWLQVFHDSVDGGWVGP